MEKLRNLYKGTIYKKTNNPENNDFTRAEDKKLTTKNKAIKQEQIAKQIAQKKIDDLYEKVNIDMNNVESSFDNNTTYYVKNYNTQKYEEVGKFTKYGLDNDGLKQSTTGSIHTEIGLRKDPLMQLFFDNKPVGAPNIRGIYKRKENTSTQPPTGGKRRTKRRRQRSNKKRTNKRKKTKTRMKKRKTHKRKTNKRRRKR